LSVLVALESNATFPKDDLTTAGFLFAAREITAVYPDPEGTDAPPGGLFRFVPLLSAIPYPIQLDLLGEVWTRHWLPRPFDATLLDAAVLYCVGQAYASIIPERREWARLWIDVCPPRPVVRLGRRTQHRLARAYRRWCPSFDPSGLRSVEQLQGESATLGGPLYAALARTRLSRLFAFGLASFYFEAEVQRLLREYGSGQAAGQQGG
jgi:hypothetical protein